MPKLNYIFSKPLHWSSSNFHTLLMEPPVQFWFNGIMMWEPKPAISKLAIDDTHTRIHKFRFWQSFSISLLNMHKCALYIHLHAFLKQWVFSFSHTPPCSFFFPLHAAMYTVQFSDLQIFQRRQCMDADTSSTISFYGVWLQIIIIMMPGQKCNTLSLSLPPANAIFPHRLCEFAEV